jgi:hypothetical protein
LSNSAELDALWVTATAIRLKYGPGCTGEADDDDAADRAGEFRLEGPIVANLLADGILGSHPELEAAPGSYCRLQVVIEALDAEALPASAPAELSGKSVLITGRRGDGVPFVASTRSTV